MTKCAKCFHSKFAAGLDQPVGCLLHTLTFSQSCPQPSSCPDFIDNSHMEGGDTMFKPILEPPEPADDLPRLVYCKHGLIECCCGVCTKHPHSVAVKGGHVVGSSAGGPTYITNPWAGQRNNSDSYYYF